MQTGTTLPPGVPLAPGSRPKGELLLRVGPLRLGTSSRHPSRPALVTIRWWGDAEPGTCVSLAPGASEAAVFPICCGPKYLVRYLKDMSSLVLHVDEAGSMAPLGRCVVDVRFLDVSRPVAGTFPVLLPQGVPQPSAAAHPHSPAMQPLGTLLRHMGTLDVRLDLGFSSATTSSFELNEHLAAQHMQMLATPRPPPSAPTGQVAASAQVLPPARHSHTQQLSQPAPGRPVHASAKALLAGDSQAAGPETPELLQVDLCQPLLTRLLHSFQRFCEVYDRWKGAAAGQGMLTVPALLTQLKARGIIEFDMSPVQSQYLAAMLDPLGDLPCDIMDEVLLAVRQALEAGLRVRSGQLKAVVTLLAPLALALQQSMVLVRKAFRRASGAMQLGQVVDVLRGVVPVLERQQVRYLFAILVHLGPSMSGGQWSGSVVIGDVQAFMRLAESWGTAAQYAGADELRTMAAAASPSTLPHSRLPAPSAPGPAVRASPTSGSSRGAARALSLGAEAGSVAIVGAGRRSTALQRLKDRMQGSRSGAGAAPGEGQQQQQQHGQQGPASAPQCGQPLLPPYQPPVPTFKSMQPLPFRALAPVQQHEAAAAASLPASTREPMQELVRQAEALRHLLAQVAGQRPPLPGSSRGYASRRTRDQQQQEEDEALQALRYVTAPHVASDIVKGVLRGRPQSRRMSRRAALRQGLSDGEGDAQRGGKRAREWRRGTGSDGSLTDSGENTGSGGWEGSSNMSWEEEQEAAEWSEQQLLAQLFFPKVQAPEADADGLMAPQRAGVQGQDQDQPGAAAAVGRTTPGSKDEGAAQLPHMRAGVSLSPNPTSNSASGHDASAEPQLQVWVHSLQLPALSAAATDPLAGGELSVIIKCPLLPSLMQCQHHALPPRPPSTSTPGQPSGDGPGGSALLHLSLPAPNHSLLPCPLVLEVWQQRTQLVGLAALSLPPAAASQPTDTAAAAPSAASPAQPPAAQAPPQPAQTSAAGWQLEASCSGTFPLSNPLTPEPEDDAADGGSSSSIALTAALHTPAPQPPLSPAHTLTEQANSSKHGASQAKAGTKLDEVQAVCHSFRVTVGGARHLADTADLKRVGQAVPLSRFLRYQYPGDAEPLFTEDVPCSGEPIFAASAVHSVTLTPEQDVGQALESLASAFTASEINQASCHLHQPASKSAAGLRFEVWDRWPATVGSSGSGAQAEAGVPEAPSPTLLALAVMPISQLADLARRAHQQQQQQSHGVAHETSADGVEQGTESDEGRASTSSPEPRAVHVPGPAAEARASPAASACTLLLPLQLASREDSAATVDAAPVPLLEVQLQYEAVPTVMAVPVQQQAPRQDSEAHTAAGAQHSTDGAAAAPNVAAGATAGFQGVATASASAAPMASVPQPIALPKTATLSVQIVQACGLQAAVYEAQAWMGSSAALLGRAHLVGPNPYASLVLVQGGPLKGRLPKMQTPYLAQSFCPEYHWQGVVSLSLDPPLMEALATQHLCVELWHHTSRSLAAALSASPLAPALLGSTSGAGGIAPAKSHAAAAGARGGMGMAAGLPPPLQPGQVQDVLLGCVAHPLLQLLSKPQGINAWLPLKSQRGEPVGAVQVAISLTHLGDKQLDVCPDAAPPLVQAPWLLDLMPAAALQHVVAQAPWTLLGAQPSQLAALNESHAAASTAVATDPYAAEPAQTPAGGEAGGGQAVPWKGGLPPGFGGQWSRLTLHVDQVVLPSPGAAAELRPKAYKYYATYMLPGSDDEVHTAAQVARMQQGGTASASGGPSLSTVTPSAKPGVSSAPATWHVPLQHCGVHWVRADEALAAALVRLPLRLRVWRAHGRVARGGSSTPSAAGPGNPALSGPQSGGPWLSSVLSGEAQVDLSALVSAAAVRRHQPNTRWLSGSFTVVDPAAKLFTNSRVQVRVLLELLPTTLPPASWLDRTAWQPQGPPLQQSPAHAGLTDPVSALSRTQAQSQDAAGGGRELQEEASKTQAGSSASPRIGAHTASAAPMAASMEGASEAARAPSPPSAALPSMSPPGKQPGGTGRTVTSLVAPSFMIDDDFMFSFRKDAVPVSLKPSLPTAGEATEGSINSAVGVQQPLPSEGGETTQGAAQAAGLLMEKGSVDAAAAATAVTEGAADTVSPALRDALRHQLQELELLSLGWQTRLGPHNGTEGDRPHEAPASTSTHNSMDRQASAVSGPAHAAGHPTAGMSPWVEGSAAAQPSSSGTALQLVVEQLPLASAGRRSAPYVAATCSEDEDDCIVWGGGGGSDTDDTDELLAAKSSLHPGAPPRLKVRAAEAGLKPGTTLTSLSFPSRWGRARDDGEGGSGEGQRPEIIGLQQATGVNNLDDWLFGFSRPPPTPTAATKSAHVPTSLPAQSAAVHPLFNNAATEQPAFVTSSSPAMAIQVPTSPAPMHPFLSSPQPSPAAPHLRRGQTGRAVLNQEGGHAGSSMTAPAASGEEHHAHVPEAATVDQEAVLPALLPLASQPEMLAGLSVDAGVEVQRVQLPECAPSAPRIRFANTLPAIQLDFKLTYMG